MDRIATLLGALGERIEDIAPSLTPRALRVVAVGVMSACYRLADRDYAFQTRV